MDIKDFDQDLLDQLVEEYGLKNAATPAPVRGLPEIVYVDRPIVPPIDSVPNRTGSMIIGLCFIGLTVAMLGFAIWLGWEPLIQPKVVGVLGKKDAPTEVAPSAIVAPAPAGVPQVPRFPVNLQPQPAGQPAPAAAPAPSPVVVPEPAITTVANDPQPAPSPMPVVVATVYVQDQPTVALTAAPAVVDNGNPCYDASTGKYLDRTADGRACAPAQGAGQGIVNAFINPQAPPVAPKQDTSAAGAVGSFVKPPATVAPVAPTAAVAVPTGPCAGPNPAIMCRRK